MNSSTSYVFNIFLSSEKYQASHQLLADTPIIPFIQPQYYNYTSHSTDHTAFPNVTK